MRVVFHRYQIDSIPCRFFLHLSLPIWIIPIPKGLYLIAKDCRSAAILVMQNEKKMNLEKVPSSQCLSVGCIQDRRVLGNLFKVVGWTGIVYQDRRIRSSSANPSLYDAIPLG